MPRMSRDDSAVGFCRFLWIPKDIKRREHLPFPCRTLRSARESDSRERGAATNLFSVFRREGAVLVRPNGRG